MLPLILSEEVKKKLFPCILSLLCSYIVYLQNIYHCISFIYNIFINGSKIQDFIIQITFQGSQDEMCVRGGVTIQVVGMSV